MSIPTLHPWTLSFSDPAAERDFRRSYTLVTLPWVRPVIVFGFVLYGGFGVLDFLVEPAMAPWTVAMRAATLLLIGLPLLVVLSRPRQQRWAPLLGLLLGVSTGVTISVMIAFSSGPMAELYFSGLILIIMFIYTLLRLRFPMASLAGLLVVASYEVAAAAAGVSLYELVVHNFFFLSANLLGMAACYVMERHIRLDFLKSLQLARERGALAEQIAQREASERMQAQLHERLGQTQKLEDLGSLAGGVAHDFNNLLTGIIGYLQLARAELPQGEAIHADLGAALDGAHRAKELTGELLAFSRKEVRRVRVLDLVELVHRMQLMLRPIIGEDVSLHLHTSDRECWVQADRGQLERVVLNLATNARDAMPTGGDLSISVELCPVVPGMEGPAVVLEVSDTGVGMDPDTQARVFEPFFTTKERGRGTGLGLSSLYGIVTQSGGQVQVESKPGQGTTFRVCLPRTTEPPSPQPKPRRRSMAGGQETVLVVEDERLVRTLAKRILERAGYEVLVAPSGGEALEVVAQHSGQIHLVLTDVVMPGLSGPELTDRLLVDIPGLRGIWMSGYADDVLTTRAKEAPAGISFLNKPFSPDALLAKVRAVLDDAGTGDHPRPSA